MTQKQLGKHNAFIKEQSFRIIKFELRIEQYLFENINKFDWTNEYPFSNKYANDIIKSNRYSVTVEGEEKREVKITDIKGVEYKVYIGDQVVEPSIIKAVVKKTKIDQNRFTDAIKRNMSIGEKIDLWKHLKSNIFTDKNCIFKQNTKSEDYKNILENIRNIRNGFAHYESLAQIQSKLRKIDGVDFADEEAVYKATLGKVRV